MTTPTNITWEDIRQEVVLDTPSQAAGHVLRRMGVVRPPVNVRRIVEQLGVRVVSVKEPGWAGAIDSIATPPTIWVNEGDAQVRQRFTLAHELGHLLLHPLGRRHRDGTFANPKEQAEVDANNFAASLLMPLWMLEPIAVNSSRSAASLAALFGVSPGALGIQLKKLV